MKKRLVFFIYTDVNYKGSKIYDLHFENLKRYSNLFDATTLYFSLKEINDENMELVKEYTKRMVDCGYVKELETKIRLNTNMREVDCFREEVISRINNHVEEIVFFTHTKGLSNELNESLFRWINGMYYFSLNFSDEMETRMIYRAIPDTFRGGCVVFGFPLLESNIEPYLKNKHFYAGTIYWINCAKVAHYNRCFGINPDKDYIISTRCFAEEFPGDHFIAPILGQHGCHGVNEKFSLYSHFDDELEMFYNSYDSQEDRVNFDAYCSDIMEKTGITL